MYSYEETFIQAFPNFRPHFEIVEKGKLDLPTCRRRAIRFLEMNSSSIYGFPAEIHMIKDNTISAKMVPGVFDTAMVLECLYDVDGIHTSLIQSMAAILLKHRQQSGMYNFILKVPDIAANLFPDDADDTAVCITSLHSAGYLADDDCRETADKMLNSLILNDKGAMSAWLEMDASEKDRILYKSLMVNPRVDIGATANVLSYLSRFGMDTDERILLSVKFLEESLDRLVENCGTDVEIPGMIYYMNRFVLYFFISRYIAASQNANELGNKLADLVTKELNLFELTPDTQALNIACLTLAAINLELHCKNGRPWSPSEKDLRETREKLLKLAEFLPSLQNNDGSFSPWLLYHYYRLGEYGCSKGMSTAIVMSAIDKVEKCIVRRDKEE